MNGRTNLKGIVAICIAFGFFLTALSVLPTNANAAQFEIVTQIGTIPSARVVPATMVTDDGMLLVVGGSSQADGGGTEYTTVVRYGLENHSVSYGATMPYDRFYTDSAVGTDGNLYVFGGWQAGYQSDIQIYNPVNNTWWTRTGAPANLGAGCAVAYTNGSIFIFNEPWTMATYMYTPSTNVWYTMTASSTDTLAGTSGVVLNDSAILVMGGWNSGVNAIATCEIYNPLTDSWSPAADMPIASAGGAAFMGNDGFVYYVGGSVDWNAASTGTDAIQRYDPVTDTWTIVSATLSSEKTMFGLALDHEGNAYVVGGFSAGGLDDIDMIQTMNLADEDEIIALQNQVTDLKNKILLLQGDVSDLTDANAALKLQIVNLSAQLNQTIDDLAAANAALGNTNNNVNNAKSAADSANMMGLIGIIIGIVAVLIAIVALVMKKK